jgi:hypothetical protein
LWPREATPPFRQVDNSERSAAFGFGEVLVAVLVSITVAFIVALQNWQKIHVRSTFGLVL